MPFGINSHAAVHVDKLEAIKVFVPGETPVKQRLGRGRGKGTPGVGVAAVAPGIKVDFLQAVATSIGYGVPRSEASAERSRSMVGVDILDVIQAFRLFHHHGKQTFRPAQVGVDGGFSSFGDVFTSTHIHLGCCAACCRVLLPDALTVVAVGDLQGFIPFGDGSHLVKGIVGNALLLRRENAG